MKKELFVIKYRWFIIIGFLVLTVILASIIPSAKIDPDLENYIPESMPSKMNTQKIENIFGSSDIVLVILETNDVLNPETLTRIKKISRKIKRLDGVSKTMSLFDTKNMKSEDGFLLIEPQIDRIPENKADIEQLRKEIIENDLAYEIVVSKDFKQAAIIAVLTTDASHDEIVTEINQIIEEYPGNEVVYKGGFPYLKASIKDDIAKDVVFLMIAGIFIMLVMLYLAFKDWRGVVLPFIVVIISIIFGMSILPIFNWEISIITILLPIILIAVANDYGIHLIAKYQEINNSTNQISNKESSRLIFIELKKPIILTALTTMAGLLCLLAHVMPPAEQLGIIAAFSIGYALIASLFFIPAMLSLIKPKKTIHRIKRYSLDHILIFLSRFVPKYPKQIIYTTIIGGIIVGSGLFLVETDANLENFFPKKHSLKQSSNIINNNFGGSQNICVLVEGDIKDPELLKRIDSYENKIKKMEGIGNVISISQVIKEISKTINEEGDEYYNKIPDTREAIAQYLELYYMSGDPEDLEQLVDFNYEHAQIIARVNNGSTRVIKNLVKHIQNLTKDDPNVSVIGGQAFVTAEISSLVIKGQTYSLIISIFIIGILIAIIFRSIVAGLIGIIPMAFSILLLFGIMGYFQIKLDVATALLSSIMIGVGVDYTIHFLWRYREERNNGLNYLNAVAKTLKTTGRGITFNAISVIVGFIVLLISSFLPIRFFGLLIVISITTCLSGALLIIPSLAILWKPKFLEPKKQKDLYIKRISELTEKENYKEAI